MFSVDANILELKAEKNNLFTSFDEILSKRQKENNLNQRGISLWLTGLSGAGKTSIGNYLEKKLFQNSIITAFLDGDNIRTGINNNLTFSEIDRIENIRLITEVAKLMTEAGLITLVSFISPFKSDRNLVRSLFSENEFLEVFIDSSLEVCEKRDPKGMYKKARKGVIKNFTGISSPYEAPEIADIHVMNDKLSPDEASDKIVSFLHNKNYIDYQP